MAILVTGAAGFVGLNLLARLLESGRAVVALDRLPIPVRAEAHFRALPGRLTFIGGSILSDADVSRAMTVAPLAGVVHCAVITSGAAREAADPDGIVEINVMGAVRVLTAAARRGVPRFIYPSSGAIYGRAAHDVPLVDETLVPGPTALYGLTKLAAEMILPRIANVASVTLAVARLTGVYGAFEYATGVRDTISPMMQAVTCARQGREAVLGPAWRGDFCHAQDCADAMIGLLDAPSLRETIFNVGSGQASDAAAWCAALACHVPGFTWRMAREGETPNVVTHIGFNRGGLSIARLASQTGFAPRHSFATAAAEAMTWPIVE